MKSLIVLLVTLFVALSCVNMALADHNHVPKSVCGNMNPTNVSGAPHVNYGGMGNFTITINQSTSWTNDQVIGVIISGAIQWNGYFISAFPEAITYPNYNNTRLGFFSNPSDGSNSSNYCYNADRSGAGLGHKDPNPKGIYNSNTGLYSTQYLWTAPNSSVSSYSSVVTFRATVITADITTAYFPQTVNLAFGGSSSGTGVLSSSAAPSSSSLSAAPASSSLPPLSPSSSSLPPLPPPSSSLPPLPPPSSSSLPPLPPSSSSAMTAMTSTSSGSTTAIISQSSSSSSSAMVNNSHISSADSLSSSLSAHMLCSVAAVVTAIVAFF